MAAAARPDRRRGQVAGAPARDTIFAVSSGSPPAAIAVMRVSGPAAGGVLETLARRLPPPRRAAVRRLRQGDALLDEAMVLWLPGPRSATGEDLVELHLHGGRATVAAVERALAAQAGLRPAEPGEFTRRAFLNGRIDLAQAEGLADLLAAETEAQRRQALVGVEGGLSRLVESWRGELLMLAARVEAQIEFGEEEEDVRQDSRIAADCIALADRIALALAQPPAERLRDGIRIVVAGPPNAGKSTLVNALSGRDVAITAPVPGTTRDLIEVPLILHGFPCILIDCAGLHEAEDPIERAGIERARTVIATADLLLWLGAPAARPRAKACIAVHTQSDRPCRGQMPADGDVAVSCMTGEGMDELAQLIARELTILVPPLDAPTFGARQVGSLRSCREALLNAAAQHDYVLRAEELRLGCVALDAITGRTGVNEMFDALFSRFCIGK